MGRSESMEIDRAEHDLSDKEKELRNRSEKEKDRGRDKEKDKEREKVRDRAREKDRDREKEKEKEKERAMAKERERLKEKEKEKDKEKGREKDRSRDKGREKEKDRQKEREREKEKDREKEKMKEKEKERDKHHEKPGHAKEKEHDTAKEKERDRHHEKLGHDIVKEKRNGKSSHSKEKEQDLELKKERPRELDREKEKEKEKYATKEKAKERDEREKDKPTDKEKSKEKEEKEKFKEKDKRDREKEKEREKEREREKEKERERDREREREKEKEREREREKEKEKERQRVRAKERERERELELERDHARELPVRELENEKHDSDRDNTMDPDRPQVSTAELADRVARMREDRMKANFHRRPSRRPIRAVEKPEAVDDIASWVNKSRYLDEKKKAEEKEKAARMAKILAEQDEEEDSDDEPRSTSKYGAKDLAGLKVRHGLDKVLEGGTVVLTLKDTNILAEGDVNDEMDELENMEMAQQQNREDAYKAAKKLPGKYEDKFNNDMTGTKAILSKYDDAVKEEGVMLDETGGLNEESQRKLEEVRRRLQTGMGDRVAESLLTTTTSLASEYFTQEEMTQFKKPKKKKKLRKKDKLDIDVLEAEALAEGLGTGDLGSRESTSRRADRQEEMKAAADVRRERYENALLKAADASKVLKEESTARSMEVDDTEDGLTFGTEEDETLIKSLERARQAALKKQAENTVGPQGIVARLAASKEESLQGPGVGNGEEGKLVFSDTGEFCRSLQLDEALTRRSGPKNVFDDDEKDDEEPAAEISVEDAPVAAGGGGGWTEVNDTDMMEAQAFAEKEEEASEEPSQEVAVGKGLAGALHLLKERGTLKETVDWGGRNMDKKKSKLIGIVDESNNVVGQRDILLDRVDEFGRTMTPKEAFRKLSHKFHGKGPGKMKQEKRQKQFQEELKLKQMNAGDTPLMSMEKIREAQAKMHAPYIVISGHIKPGQTSDPRSGFATVEKEPVGSLTPMLGDNKNVGSLTPMLGDKKVAHFLGIKRKPESGSMGPPPNKKPKAEH